MTTTITENLISELNEYSMKGNAESLGSAVKYTIDLFGKQVSNGLVNEDAISDFSEMVTMYKYTDTPQISVSVSNYFKDTIQTSLEARKELSDISEIGRRVA